MEFRATVSTGGSVTTKTWSVADLEAGRLNQGTSADPSHWNVWTTQPVTAFSGTHDVTGQRVDSSHTETLSQTSATDNASATADLNGVAHDTLGVEFSTGYNGDVLVTMSGYRGPR